MKKLVIAILFIPTFLRAEPPQSEPSTPDNDVFLSLTRTPLDASRRPSNTTVITQEEIERTSAKTLGEVLEQATPMVIKEAGTTGSLSTPQLHGFFSSGVAIYIDERRIPPDASGTVDLSQIPLDNVEKIEIVTGAGSVLYGANTLGGVVHIRTKRPKAGTPMTAIQTSFGSFGTSLYQGHYGTRVGRFDAFVSGSESKTNGYQEHAENRTTGGSLRMGYDFGLPGRTNIQGQFSDSSVQLPGGTDVPIGEWDGKRERVPKNSTDFQNSSLYTGAIEHVYEMGESIKVTGRASATRRRIDGISDGFPGDTFVRNRSGYLQTDLPHGFTTGYEYEQQRIDSLSLAGKTNTWAVFFQEQWGPGPWLFIPAVRYDHNTEYGSTTNPRLSTVFTASPWLKFSSNVGSSFRPPTFFEKFGGFGIPASPDVRPEKAWQYDLGLEVHPASWRAALTAYRTDSSDRIFNDPTDLNKAKNLNKAFSQGLDAALEQKWGSWFRHGANYAYLQNKGQSVGSSQYAVLPYSPRHKANYWVSLNTPFRLEILNTLQFVSRQFNGINESDLKLPSYMVWNVRLTQRILDGEIFLGVRNITEERYTTNGFSNIFGTGINPQPGRTYELGLSVKFWN